MEEVRSALEAAADSVARLLDADIEYQAGQIVIKKKRTLQIFSDNRCFTCRFDHDISFEKFQQNGTALNKAQIFLLPEEYPAFFCALSEHRIPFPPHYRQWQRVNPHIISVCIESLERPEHFAERLASAVSMLGQ